MESSPGVSHHELRVENKLEEGTSSIVKEGTSNPQTSLGKPLASATVDFIAGTSSGIAGLVVGYPFDTVKVRFQNPEISIRYKSTVQAVGTILREETVGGLYKGILSPMVSLAPLNGLLFSSYRYLLRSQLEDENSEPTIIQVIVAGTGTGVIGSLITCPIEVLKIRQQSSLNSRLGLRELIVDTWRTNGTAGFYRGVTASILRDLGYGAYFGTYESCCRYFSGRNIVSGYPTQQPHMDHSELVEVVDAKALQLPWYAPPISGALAGVISWIVTFPFDVVKTRIQSVNIARKPHDQWHRLSTKHPFTSTLSTIANSYRSEGLGVFFRGLSPTIIRRAFRYQVTEYF